MYIQTKYSVVHQLEKVFFKIISCTFTFLSVKIYIRSEPRGLMKL